MKDEHKREIYTVIRAIDDCEGIEIPYPTVKKMAQVSKELKGYLERVIARETEGEEEEEELP